MLPAPPPGHHAKILPFIQVPDLVCTVVRPTRAPSTAYNFNQVARCIVPGTAHV